MLLDPWHNWGYVPPVEIKLSIISMITVTEVTHTDK